MAGPGGAYGNAFRKHLTKWGEANAVKISFVEGLVSQNYTKLKSTRANPEIDLYLANGLTNEIGLSEGMYEKLDPGIVTRLRDIYPIARNPNDVGVCQGFLAVGLQYNTKKYAEAGIEPPKSWLDLWDPRLKGRVGLQSIGSGYTQPLVAMIAKLQGGNEEDYLPGIRKLKELKPNLAAIVPGPAEQADLFTQERIWLGNNGSNRAYELREKGFPVEFVYPKEGAIFFANYFQAVKGAPHPKAAQYAINMLLGEEAQQELAIAAQVGPSNRTVVLTPDVAKLVPYGEQAAGKMVALDWGKINVNLAKYIESWNREIAQ